MADYLPAIRWLHLLAASVWTGGLIVLGALVVALRRAGVEREVLRAAARQYGAYENSIGTGQVHLWFDAPDGGFPRPHRTPEDPDFVRQMGGPDLPAAG